MVISSGRKVVSNRTSERKALIVFGERPWSVRNACHEPIAVASGVWAVKWEANFASGMISPVFFLSYSLAKKGGDVNWLSEVNHSYNSCNLNNTISRIASDFC